MSRLLIWLLFLGGVASSSAAEPAFGEERPTKADRTNVIKNADFQNGEIGELPEDWSSAAARSVLMPVFRLEEHLGRKQLLGTGDGNDTCTGYLFQTVLVNLGRTYLYRVVFRMSDELDPNRNLLFRCARPGVKNGIFSFRKLEEGYDGEVFDTELGDLKTWLEQRGIRVD